MSCALLVVALVGCGACDAEPCGGSLKEGASLEIEVIEKWNKDSRFSFEEPPIPPTDEPSDLNLPSCLVEDVKLGDTYRWNIDDVSSGNSSTGCYEALCPDDFPTPSTSFSSGTTGRPRVQGVYPCKSYDRVAEVMGCEVGRVVGLVVDEDADLFDEPTVGDKPPVVIVRRFVFYSGVAEMQCADPASVFSSDAMMSDSAGDFWECADAWVVRVKKR